MKTLLLARHAKSGWEESVDFNRTLSDKGEADVKKMAAYLHDCGYVIHQIISSDALRALATAEEYQRQLSPKTELMTHHDLYNASMQQIIDIARTISADASTVIVVGHNPGMQEAINYLAREKISDLPSCSVAIIQFEINDWKEVGECEGDLLAFEYPKKIRDDIV